MFDSLSLEKKGYALIAMPMLFQILFVSVLVTFLAQEQKAADIESKSGQAILEGHILMKRLTELGINHHSYAASKGLAGKLVDVEDVTEINRMIDTLTKLTTSNSAVKVNEKRFRRNLEQFSKLVTQEDDSIYQMAKGNKLKLGKKASRIFQEMIASIESLIESQSQSIALVPEVISQKRGLVHMILIFAGIANMLLAFFIARSFSSNITSRLEKVVSKAERLSKRESIGDELPGLDKISEVDKLIHLIDKEVGQSIAEEKSVIANTADAIVVSDNHGIITSCNYAASRLFGKTEEQLCYLSVLDLLIDENVLAMNEQLSNLNSGKDVGVSEYSILQSNERTCPTQWSMYSIEDGKSLFSIIHDLSEVKEVENLKREFVSMISHDLRSPLTAIENSISIVLLGAFGSIEEKGQLELEGAQRNANRLIKLINDFLDMEKLKSGRMQILVKSNQLSKLVENALEMVSGNLSEKELKVEVGDLEHIVVCDSDRIEQVLVNLLSNAINYSSRNEVIRLMARRMDDFVQILVVDTGPGIPDHVQDQIFNPYEQVDAKRETEKKGTGLGLSIASSIIHEHGCDIGVFSMLEHGSTFWFTLPVDKQNGEKE